MNPILISVLETQKVLSVGKTKLYDLIREGRLQSVQIGRRRLIRFESVSALADVDPDG